MIIEDYEGIESTDYSNFVYLLLDEINNIIGTWGKFGRKQEIIKLKLNEIKIMKN